MNQPGGITNSRSRYRTLACSYGNNLLDLPSGGVNIVPLESRFSAHGPWQSADWFREYGRQRGAPFDYRPYVLWIDRHGRDYPSQPGPTDHPETSRGRWGLGLVGMHIAYRLFHFRGKVHVEETGTRVHIFACNNVLIDLYSGYSICLI